MRHAFTTVLAFTCKIHSIVLQSMQTTCSKPLHCRTAGRVNSCCIRAAAPAGLRRWPTVNLGRIPQPFWSTTSRSTRLGRSTLQCTADQDYYRSLQDTKPSKGNSYLSNGGSLGNGCFLLLLLNLGIFAADHLLHLPFVQSLYLYHANPKWWEFITCCFCHSNWQHLSGNMFMLLVFGNIVEAEGEAWGLWITYLLCGVGGALASYWSCPGSYTVSLGASGAIFGLFAVGVLSKLSFNLRKLVEAFVLGQFVVQQVVQEVAAQAAVLGKSAGASSVSHVAHLGGAAAGVLLVWLLSRIPDPAADN